MDRVYVARNDQQRKAILNQIKPETIIRFVLQNICRLQKNPKYLVSAVLIALLTSHIEVLINTLTFLSKLLPSIGSLSIDAMSELKQVYTHLTCFAQLGQQGASTDVRVVRMVLQSCGFCAMFLLIHAISQEDCSAELSSLQEQVQANCTMIDIWERKGVFGNSNFYIIRQIDIIKDVGNRIRELIHLDPTKREKFVGLSGKLINFKEENKSIVTSVLKSLSVTEKLGILVSVCSLASAKREQKFMRLLYIVFTEVTSSKFKKDQVALIVLQAVFQMAEKIENPGMSTGNYG